VFAVGGIGMFDP